MIRWEEELKKIIAEYKAECTERLDSNDVEDLVNILRAKINYLEENITEEEYQEELNVKTN